MRISDLSQSPRKNAAETGWTPAPPAAEADQNREFPYLDMPWVDSPFLEAELDRSDLPQDLKEKVKFYAREGYLILDLDLPGFDGMAQSITEGLDFKFRIQDAWKSNGAVKAIASSPQVLSMLRILYRRAPFPFQTLNFNVGTQQATHSDTIHFHCVPSGFMCGVWVALEDIDVENGPLHYYPGSHKLPCYDLTHLGYAGSFQTEEYQHYPKYTAFLQALIDCKGLERRELHVKKGQALIWAANLLHGGCPILDKSRSRWSQVTHYYFENCLYYTPMHSDPFVQRVLYRGIRDIRTGEHVENRYGRYIIPSVPSYELGWKKPVPPAVGGTSGAYR